MPTRTFVTTGFAHHTELVHEYGVASTPLTLFYTLEAFDEVYPPSDRDEFDSPVKVTCTYEVEVPDEASLEELDAVLASLTVEVDEDSSALIHSLKGG